MSRKERGSTMKIEWKAGAPELKEAIEASTFVQFDRQCSL